MKQLFNNSSKDALVRFVLIVSVAFAVLVGVNYYESRVSEESYATPSTIEIEP